MTAEVATWQTPKREGPNIPPLRFVEVLIKEAQERANLQDRAAAVFLHQYGELLKLYCARANPHNVHRQMLLDYQNTLLIRELNDATNAALEKVTALTEELQTLREDRDGERRRRITLQQQIDSLNSPPAMAPNGGDSSSSPWLQPGPWSSPSPSTPAPSCTATPTPRAPPAQAVPPATPLRPEPPQRFPQPGANPRTTATPPAATRPVGTPRAATPRAGTLPVGTPRAATLRAATPPEAMPRAATPPAGTPLAGTPPVARPLAGRVTRAAPAVPAGRPARPRRNPPRPAATSGSGTSATASA